MNPKSSKSPSEKGRQPEKPKNILARLNRGLIYALMIGNASLFTACVSSTMNKRDKEVAYYLKKDLEKKGSLVVCKKGPQAENNIRKAIDKKGARDYYIQFNKEDDVMCGVAVSNKDIPGIKKRDDDHEQLKPEIKRKTEVLRESLAPTLSEKEILSMDTCKRGLFRHYLHPDFENYLTLHGIQKKGIEFIKLAIQHPQQLSYKESEGIITLTKRPTNSQNIPKGFLMKIRKRDGMIMQIDKVKIDHRQMKTQAAEWLDIQKNLKRIALLKKNEPQLPNNQAEKIYQNFYQKVLPKRLLFLMNNKSLTSTEKQVKSALQQGSLSNIFHYFTRDGFAATRKKTTITNEKGQKEDRFGRPEAIDKRKRPFAIDYCQQNSSLASCRALKNTHKLK